MPQLNEFSWLLISLNFVMMMIFLSLMMELYFNFCVKTFNNISIFFFKI